MSESCGLIRQQMIEIERNGKGSEAATKLVH